jgi:hypothetical protein
MEEKEATLSSLYCDNLSTSSGTLGSIFLFPLSIMATVSIYENKRRPPKASHNQGEAQAQLCFAQF